MRITVTRTIDINGKVDQKIAEAEPSVDPLRTREQQIQDTARALFESMNPPAMIIEHDPEWSKRPRNPANQPNEFYPGKGATLRPPAEDITALMLIIGEDGIITSGYCVMGWSSASFVSRPANLIIWLKKPTAELRSLAEEKMKTFPHSRTINAYANKK